MKRIFEHYLKNIPHKGKRHTVRWLLKMFRYNYLASHYGPIMRVNRCDKTNIYALSGEYGDTVANHVRNIKPGDVFIDIGTNYGLFSLIASEKVGTDGLVLSFEPNPQIYSYFLDNIQANGCRNIIPFHCAIAHEEGFMGLTFEKGHSGKSHLSESGDLTVPTFNPTKWEFLTDKIGERTVHIKVDVEGYEAEIIKILSTAPWFSNVASIVVEIDDSNLASFNGNAQADIYAPLKAAGLMPTVNAGKAKHYDEIFVR